MVSEVTIPSVRKKAFFSGTDDRDDNGNCTISGVVGKLSSTCEMVFRFNLPGNMKIANLKSEDIFATEADNFEVPKEWLSQVKREAPKTVHYGKGNNWQDYGYGNAYGGGFGRNDKKVVANPNMRQGNLGLSADDEEVLAAFGYPFVNDGNGGDTAPFANRPLGQGRKTQKVTRLPKKTR